MVRQLGIGLARIVVALAAYAALVSSRDGTTTPPPQKNTVATAPAQDRGEKATGPTVPTSPEMRKERGAFIQKLIARGLLTTVERPATFPHVWVTPAFRALDYQTQNTFVGVVFAHYYAGTSGPASPLLDHGRTVVLKDSQTGKQIGTYSRLHAGLKYD